MNTKDERKERTKRLERQSEAKTKESHVYNVADQKDL